MLLLYFILGVAILPGILIMIISGVANTVVGKALMRIRREQLKDTDMRMRLVSEAVGGIRVVKYNCLEPWLIQRITAVRASELRRLKTQAYLNAVNRLVSLGLGRIVALYCSSSTLYHTSRYSLKHSVPLF